MSSVLVSESFISIQGESTYSGLSCFFVRLTGCNLRCNYCDTEYAYSGGTEIDVTELVQARLASGAAIAEITGGEPLLQDGFTALAKVLRDSSEQPVLVETNGSQDIELIPEGVIAVVDVKSPGSGEGDSFYMPNIDKLRDYDEVKFVLSDESDYVWAKDFIREHGLIDKCHAVLFGAVAGKLDVGTLGQWIVADKLGVRLQVQLHKIINVA
ncbi:MAG: radical SAM protein [Kiritimatiellae bacterium]|nr:radical SAM protein [Kiritimatiellia bacterium]